MKEFNTVGGPSAVGVQGNAVTTNGNIAIPTKTYKESEEELKAKKVKKPKKAKKIKK
tara:strand:+ start:167 stop:337 length:171 start_codon:yes stop_codon:yes gene_type:complete